MFTILGLEKKRKEKKTVGYLEQVELSFSRQSLSKTLTLSSGFQDLAHVFDTLEFNPFNLILYYLYLLSARLSGKLLRAT